MNTTVTGQYIQKQIAAYKALKTKDEKDTQRTPLFRNVKAIIGLNIEAIDEDVLKRYEHEASKAFDLLEEKDFVINVKFGSNSVGELKFKAYSRAEAEEKAKLVGAFVEKAYHEEIKRIAKARMDAIKAEENAPEQATA